MLSGFVLGVELAELVDASEEEVDLLEQLFQDLHVLVVDWLVQQVVQAEPACNNQHQALIQLCSDIEEHLVIILELQAVVLQVVDQPHLLLVEELPHLEHVLQVVASHLVEVAFQGAQLLLVLLLENLEVEF